MKILAIETSCDETSVSIVEDGKRILSLATYSQIEIHKDFDGVVPEIASRNHLSKLIDVLENSTKNLTLNEIDCFAATNGPGLVGSLLVGTNAAKTLALIFRKPYIPVNHILSHMYAPHIENQIDFPYIGLVASGGHTILFKVSSFHEIEFLGSTIDDAIGEAFDKIAKFLGLGYPGGPIIDKISTNGKIDLTNNFSNITLPLSDEKDRYNFSYSGLKTAIIYRVKKMNLNEEVIKHVVKNFQFLAIEHLLDKTLNALNDFRLNRLVISGGVSANSYLRKRLEDIKKEKKIEVYTASLKLCSDNAAMVAGRAYVDYLKNPSIFSEESFKDSVFSRLSFIKKGKRG